MDKKTILLATKVDEDFSKKYRALCKKLKCPMSMINRAGMEAIYERFKKCDDFSLNLVCLTKSEYDDLIQKAGVKHKK